ncbi:MAG TPA: hypothetical protein VD866_11995 [Urbifossiella sp.]|nr:hypothetical protein [Urbifossiella sp.]
MRRAVPLFLFACPVFVAAADPADDRAKLQGVWHSVAGAKQPVRVLVMGDKIGYAVGDATATPAVPGSAFVSLTEATVAKGVAELVITKDYTRKLGYRIEKDGVVVTLDDKEYPLRRVNTRATDPAAKELAGTWTLTGAEVKGVKLTPAMSGIESLTIVGDRYVVKAPGGKELLSSFYRLGDAKAGRADLDIFGMKADPSIAARLEVKGDELLFAQPLKPGGPRPTGFDSGAAEVLVLRATRAK